MDRAPLSTDPGDYCFIDTETRSPEDVTSHGAYRHTGATGFMVLIVTYAIGDGPVQAWVVDAFDQHLDWHDAPKDLRTFQAKAVAGKGWYVAWNAAFDRLALNRGLRPYGTLKAPLIRVDMVIDAMAQGAKSHLPPDLKGAAQYSGAGTLKDTNGKALIKLFCGDGDATPRSHPEEWAQFVSYAKDDIGALRDVFNATLPLGRAEWEEYWASERVNDRGLPLDVDFVQRASELAEYNAGKANADVAALSGGALRTVNQAAKITDWVMDRLDHLPRVHDILTKEIVEGEPDEDGNDVDVVKLSLERSRVEEVILYLEALDKGEGLTDTEFEALQMLEIRVYGASATPRKFTKMLRLVDPDGSLRGQYVLNGAPATGRFSSRGIQTHNLTRSTVAKLGAPGDPQDDEAEAIDMIIDGGAEAYEPLREAFGPVGRTLSRVIRPAITAPPGHVLAWGDWSAIEARVLPWLADRPKANELLDTFRENDADPSLPDIYKVTASGILRVLGSYVPAEEVSKKQRQSHGKVPVLSLGFGGGNGALFAMGGNYGVSFSDDEATQVVGAWRDSNTWARAFWDELWQAALSALENPGHVYAAGRVELVMIEGYLSGTLFMILPCGRELLYPRIKWERREVKDKSTGKVKTRTQLTYRRGRGRSPIWYGTLAENATQGFAGSLQRNAVRLLQDICVGHTHDEDLVLLREADMNEGVARLTEVMNAVPAWAEGLPLKAEVVTSEYYTKTID